MSRQGRLFDPGIILLWAENGLKYISLAMEKKTEKFLRKWHQRDTIKQRLSKHNKQRKKENQVLAKEQDSLLDFESTRVDVKTQKRTFERLTQLEHTEAEVSHESEIEH